MKTRLSSKGQIVLPGALRKQMGFESGDTFDVTIENDRVVLTRSSKPSSPIRIITDPKTGLPVLSSGAANSSLTSAQIAELLHDFP